MISAHVKAIILASFVFRCVRQNIDDLIAQQAPALAGVRVNGVIRFRASARYYCSTIRKPDFQYLGSQVYLRVSVSGDKGLQLEFTDNKKFLIGTNKAEELTEALKKIGQLKQ